MRTAQQSSPTKDRLLDAAQALMLTKGFAATTVDEICAAAKLTKGSFFHYFDSKDQLGKKLLERFCATMRQLHAACGDTESDPLKRVYAYLDNVMAMAQDPANSQGCLLGLFSQELCETNPKIQEACEQGFCEWSKALAHELAKAKARYAPKASIHPNELAEYIIAVVEGSMILSKAQKDRSVIQQNLRHVKSYLKHLFGR